MSKEHPEIYEQYKVAEEINRNDMMKTEYMRMK